MSVTIKFRRGNSAEWTSSGSTVLASGEPGYEIDTGRMKIGDGVTAWSGLYYASVIPTGLIGGSGISINLGTNGSTATINVSGINEQIDDRVAELLVEGTGVNLTYNDASGTLTIDNLHTEVNILSQEPQGFVNRTDSIISFNDSTRTFTIQPAVASGQYDIYVRGIKVSKTGVENVVIGTGTALNFLHFSATAPYQLQTKTTFFDFVDDVPIGYIHWNSSINQSTFFGEERHGIKMDTATHKWIHNTFGMQYIDGLSIGYSGLQLDGSLDSHAQISLSNGVLYQEDIIVNVVDDNGSNSANNFVQPLNPIAYTPVYYHSGETGQWVRDSGIPFPLKYNGTGPLYNLYDPGPPPNWTVPNVDDNKYFAMWLVATNDINDPILAIMGQREDSSLGAAENNNIWSDINLTNIPVFEFKPLYRLIFQADNAYTNTPKATLQSVLDLRLAIITTVEGVTQNDHGSLFGLGDDDHNQYVHINTARTITAIHTFNNGLVSSGLLTSTSGNFGSLSVNGTGVSVSGHTHTTSNITNFNTAFSGLLPTISNSGDNRILTSTGSSVGINAESNLTFNGSTLSVSGLVSASSGNFINSLQFNGINYLDTTTYIVARPGDNLITKYNEAKALTPRGIAKSATNRASLIVMPGTYVLSAELTVDTQFVDVIGLGSQIKKSAVLLTTNTINVTANDVRVQGISVGDQNFKIANNKPLQIIENCVGNGMFSFGGNDIFSGGTPLTISGTFIGCFSSGMFSFGGANTVSGRFIDCEGATSSFGGSGGIVSGYFERCIAAENSFGQNGLVSGTFLYCVGGPISFGGSGGPSFGPHTGTPQASGVFKYCSAGTYSFGGGNFAAGIASGIFLYCNASDYSFGGFGSGSLANGTFKYCTGGLKCFCCGSGSIASGYFEYCTGGNGSFAGVDGVSGDTTGTFNYCIAGDNSFGSNINGFYNYCTAGNDSFKQYIGGILNYCKAGTTSFAADLGGAISGVLNNCVGGNNSFNYATPITITGKLHNCIVSSGTFPTPASGGKLINCIDGDGNVITIT